MAQVNVRKRGEKWEYRFEGASIGGKRKQITKGGFRTKREALEAGNAALATYNRGGNPLNPTEVSTADYLDYWYTNYCVVNLRHNTLTKYTRDIEQKLKPAFGQYRLVTLTPAIIQEYINKLMTDGLSKSTINGVLLTLSAAMNYAIEPMGYLQYNPCDRVKVPKGAKPAESRPVITLEQFCQMIDRFPEGNRYHIPLMIGFHTGLRKSEICGLTWDDIDFEEMTLTVNKQIVKREFKVDSRTAATRGEKEVHSGFYFGPPKTETSNRTIKIGETLCKALKKERRRQMENELKYAEYYTAYYEMKEKDEKGKTITRLLPAAKGLASALPRVKLICIRENGEFTSPISLLYCARVVTHELGIDFSFHSLRHTHATVLIENGVEPTVVQARLGHTDVRTTLQRYVHNTDKMEQSAVDVMEILSSKLTAAQ